VIAVRLQVKSAFGRNHSGGELRILDKIQAMTLAGDPKSAIQIPKYGQ
jgi:hypothetical protein